MSRNRRVLEKMFKVKTTDLNFIGSPVGAQIIKEYVKGVLKLDDIEDWKIEAIIVPFHMMRRGEVELNY